MTKMELVRAIEVAATKAIKSDMLQTSIVTVTFDETAKIQNPNPFDDNKHHFWLDEILYMDVNHVLIEYVEFITNIEFNIQ